jgi:murein DD-endopeptidase MepM/ murein hydrolase activator NlpD
MAVRPLELREVKNYEFYPEFPSSSNFRSPVGYSGATNHLCQGCAARLHAFASVPPVLTQIRPFMLSSFLLASAISAQNLPIAPANPSANLPANPQSIAPALPNFPVYQEIPVPRFAPSYPGTVSAGGLNSSDRSLRSINPTTAYILPNQLMPDLLQAQPWQIDPGHFALSYPLSAAAPITSAFGWRQHPISGDRRFHSGTDLGASQGMPVLAAATGRVTGAKSMGGYGLAVTIEHDGRHETLYGHLSELMVRSGEMVRSGQVIGLVGSTGSATGPHLHFELRRQSPKGWIALDPTPLLRQAQNVASR